MYSYTCMYTYTPKHYIYPHLHRWSLPLCCKPGICQGRTPAQKTTCRSRAIMSRFIRSTYFLKYIYAVRSFYIDGTWGSLIYYQKILVVLDKRRSGDLVTLLVLRINSVTLLLSQHAVRCRTTSVAESSVCICGMQQQHLLWGGYDQ